MGDIVHLDPRLHDIYRMRDLSGRLLYIGVTNGGLRRFMEHAKDKTWWREVAQIDVEHVHCSRPVIEAIEREAIRSERPLYNVTHNVGVQLPPPPPANPPTPMDVAELVRRLDELGVPDSASRRSIILSLRSNGLGARHSVIVNAQAYRQRRAEQFSPEVTPAPPPTPRRHGNDAICIEDIVSHPAFGVGVVTSTVGYGDERDLVIQFHRDGVGTKQLSSKWAPLTIVKAVGKF